MVRVGVSNRDDSGFHWDLRPLESRRVPRTVDFLVVVINPLWYIIEVADGLKDFFPNDRMGFHSFPFGSTETAILVQDTLWYPNLPDVVQQSGKLDLDLVNSSVISIVRVFC